MVQLLAHHQHLSFALLLGGFLALLVAFVILAILVAIKPRQGEAQRKHARPELAVAAVLTALDAKTDIWQPRFARKLNGRRRLFDLLLQHFELWFISKRQRKKL